MTIKGTKEIASLMLKYIDEHIGSDLPLDDKSTFDLLSRGDTDGIYLMDSDWDRYDLQQIKPSNMDELTATVALSHSPRMNPYIYAYIKMAKVHPFVYPVCEEIPRSLLRLDISRGLLLYKEQVEAIQAYLNTMSDDDKRKYAIDIRRLTNEIEHRKGTVISLNFARQRALQCYRLAILKANYPEEFNVYFK